MRIHQLTISAFGPFAGRHVIDFEDLNDAGVFLVSGPTGAGKTSILDAICFALFGQVPGDRGVKTLRSDHAAPEERPEIELDFSLGERRFVVRRTPEWERPKKTGQGTTKEKAGAVLLESTGGQERLVSSRAAEVGHYLHDLLGMSAGQFQQVAMLPQGEFQTFLRATSQERHDVLQQLFRTERFTRIEAWVHEHSRRLREEAASGEAAVRRLVDTMSDRAGIEPPLALDSDRLALAASTGAVLPWADSLIERARATLTLAVDTHGETARRAERARAAHDEALRVTDLRRRRAEAESLLATLADDDVEESRTLLEADTRAARCLPVLRLLDQALDRYAAASRAVAGDPQAADPEAELAAGTQRLARLQALVPREHELRKLRDALSASMTALRVLTPKLQAARSELDAQPARRDALVAVLDAAVAIAGGLPAAEQQVERASAVARAAELRPAAEAKLVSRREAARNARDAAADAREHMLTVIERRLEGMAAELAGTLSVGRPCQVCGSTEHPAPASGGSDAVGEAEQLAATTAAEAKQRIHEAASARVLEAELEVEALRQASSGLTPDQAREALAVTNAALAEAQTAEATVAATRAKLAELDVLVEQSTTLVRRLEDEHTRVSTTMASQSAAVGELELELAAELDDDAGLAETIRRVSTRLSRLSALVEARKAEAAAADDALRHRTAAEQAVLEAGFDRLDDARAASLTAVERDHHQQAVIRHDELLRETLSVLADPALRDLPAAPDPATTAAELEQALAAEAAGARAHHLAREVHENLTLQRRRLDEALAAWAPSREKALTAEAMSKLVRGMGADNQLQLRLSSYVLATRLDQVVDAANDRLMHMREQRYLLERTGDAARKGSQAGLGLKVVDEWTGEARDPATLSGGETFVVSLALALGLSDVVSYESGGVQLGTLFIDEGFGMLDLDTLDDVMDRLDSLRAGGRTVGVVSHVTELRNRIPTQLHVDKRRDGSSVSITTLVG